MADLLFDDQTAQLDRVLARVDRLIRLLRLAREPDRIFHRAIQPLIDRVGRIVATDVGGRVIVRGRYVLIPHASQIGQSYQLADAWDASWEQVEAFERRALEACRCLLQGVPLAFQARADLIEAFAFTLGVPADEIADQIDLVPLLKISPPRNMIELEAIARLHLIDPDLAPRGVTA